MAYRSGLMAACVALSAMSGAAAGTKEATRPDVAFYPQETRLFASLNPTLEGKKHTVIEGENDWKIAKRYGVTVQALHDANPTVNWRGLQIGQKINVPGGGDSAPVKTSIPANGKHTVVSGDNDVLIAKAYGMKLSALHAANPGVDWRKLQIGQKISIVASGNAKPVGKTASNTKAITTEKVRVRIEGARIRREPSTDSGIRTSVDKGTIATILSREGDWYELRFPKGTVGWVRSDMLEPYKSSGSSKSTNLVAKAEKDVNGDKAAHLISTARTLLGVRYKWGGTSRGGVDCSGFTTYVFAKSGIRLPRTSIEQSKIGFRVEKDDLQAGDLVFFITGRRSSRVNHVGMYIGDGNFIHSSSHRHKVVVTPLSDYMSAYAGARRLPQLMEAVNNGGGALIIDETVFENEEPDPAKLFPTRVVVAADKTLR